ncbi:MAG: N-acetylglucosamine-6-phosphate deacetylase [Cypionkella sp.]|nr:N-acetylglucosamine-6-phosphate deacetylase [Cypionkella sp.]
MHANQTDLIWIYPDALYDGQRLMRGAALALRGDKTGEIVATARLPKGAHVVKIDGTLCAGFLDLQVNGGGGALLNNDPSVETLAQMVAAHRAFGTVAILPTVISDAPDVLERAVHAVLSAQPYQAILGLHIEGPHISLARRGTHLAAHIRPFDARTMAQIQRLRAAGVFVKITLAPEAVTASQVAQIVSAGAVVSIGHSDASAGEVRALLDAGASCFTHLFNAMSPMLSRAAGVAGACINSSAYAGIICDGHHVADEMIALAIRARPLAGRMFLVSDAMATVGGPDHFELYGQDVHLRDGRLVNSEGALAGAHLTMSKALARLIHTVGISAEVALDMAIAAPARLIGRPTLSCPVDRDARDILILNDDWDAIYLADHPAISPLRAQSLPRA